jgi:azurin
MKRLLALLIPVLLFACSGNESKKETTEQPATTSTSATSDLMKEEPTYDPTKIDPNAKVVDITLNAEGNTMTEMKYDTKEIKVAAGSTVRIKFKNKGKDAAMIHNFVLIEEGSADTVASAGIAAGPSKGYVPSMSKVLFGSKLLQPQEETEFTIPAPAKGVYDYICTYPGHYKMMNGKFIVE